MDNVELIIEENKILSAENLTLKEIVQKKKHRALRALLSAIAITKATRYKKQSALWEKERENNPL